MYKRLTRSRIRGEREPSPPPTWDRNYLNNYFTMYKRLTRSCIRVELASPAYLELKII